ncbi:MAG: DciA family protein [Treponema sp.]|nr:DciA family protein [Treponema sp.]
MNDNIISAGKLMEILFSNLNVEDSSRAATISSEWKKIVSKIKSSPNIDEKRNDNLGNNISDHSKIVDLKNGVLLVEADHPGYINLLQFYKNFILKGFQMNGNKYKIKNIAFKLSGARGFAEESIEKKEADGIRMAEIQIKKEDECIKPAESEFLSKRTNKELPQELKNIFENIEKDFAE